MGDMKKPCWSEDKRRKETNVHRFPQEEPPDIVMHTKPGIYETIPHIRFQLGLPISLGTLMTAA